eukprot:474127_1
MMQQKTTNIKIAFSGEEDVGKYCLQMRYVTGRFEERYIEPGGFQMLEKEIKLNNTNIVINIWTPFETQSANIASDLLYTDAKCIMLIFDLMRKDTLVALKKWYKNAIKQNSDAFVIITGAKYDLFEQ